MSTPEPKPPFDMDQSRADCLAAIRRAITPEKLAEVFAGLPLESQLRIAAKYLVEPPVRRRIKIVTSRKRKP